MCYLRSLMVNWNRSNSIDLINNECFLMWLRIEQLSMVVVMWICIQSHSCCELLSKGLNVMMWEWKVKQRIQSIDQVYELCYDSPSSIADIDITSNTIQISINSIDMIQIQWKRLTLIYWRRYSCLDEGCVLSVLVMWWVIDDMRSIHCLKTCKRCFIIAVL